MLAAEGIESTAIRLRSQRHANVLSKLLFLAGMERFISPPSGNSSYESYLLESISCIDNFVFNTSLLLQLGMTDGLNFTTEFCRYSREFQKEIDTQKDAFLKDKI